MLLTEAELAFVRSHGLYITEKCSGCGKLLNQTFRYTIADDPAVFCSAVCRDLAFFTDQHEARKRSTPKACAYCGDRLGHKRRDSLFCDDRCRKRFARANPTSPLVRDRVRDAARPNSADSDLAVSMG